ncbi:SDR family NAD(P)-dependent oxidoreductase [Olsenella sp. Marseille-QA0557]|uniref:SDR family NAD(P)-dependent oxidoreductase n=1 Tax=Olsenella sp. Marseille-QA0557 TaxID=3378782 RepID=UPI003D107B4C
MRALVTGGSRGIGRATAKIFRDNGYEVITPTRNELDLSSKSSIEAYISAHKDEPLDTLVNNAGINDLAFIEDANDAVIERMFEVDLMGPIRLLRGFIPSLRKSDIGRIVNIGSIWAAVSKPGRGLYSAAKRGLHGITNALACEVAEDGVLVNTICPGFTATELTIQNNTPAEIKELERLIPLGRMADPEEIAKAVYYFGSKENTYITGQKILVDGGYTIK